MVLDTASPSFDPVHPRLLVTVWLATAVTSIAAMPLYTGFETLPFHVALVVFVILYGLGLGEQRLTLPSLALFWLISTVQFVLSAANGDINWIETTELPLLAILMGMVMRNIQRRQRALVQVHSMAIKERAVADSRDWLTRITSHELRTPLTVARGYVELMMTTAPGGQWSDDLTVVDEELNRLERVCERLVRAIALEGGSAHDAVDLDLDRALNDVRVRWAAIAARRWQVESTVGHVVIAPERLRASLDTMIENALRYTPPGGTIRLFASQKDGMVTFGVADSGPGLRDDQITAINAWRDLGPADLDTPLLDEDFRDQYSQTGLGLAMVHALARARGGWLVAGRSREGGAQLGVEFPLVRSEPDSAPPPASARPPYPTPGQLTSRGTGS